MKRYIIWILFLFLLVGFGYGCSPKIFEPYQPPVVEFEKTEPYVLDLTKLQKPDKPNYIVIDEDFNPVAESGKAGKYLAFTQEEFKKILVLNQLYKSQDKLLKDHESLVNIYISEVNALKELVAIKEQMLQQYITLYSLSENAYRQEKWEHNWDNTSNKIVQILLLGGLVLLML